MTGKSTISNVFDTSLDLWQLFLAAQANLLEKHQWKIRKAHASRFLRHKFKAYLVSPRGIFSFWTPASVLLLPLRHYAVLSARTTASLEMQCKLVEELKWHSLASIVSLNRWFLWREARTIFNSTCAAACTSQTLQFPFCTQYVSLRRRNRLWGLSTLMEMNIEHRLLRKQVSMLNASSASHKLMVCAWKRSSESSSTICRIWMESHHRNCSFIAKHGHIGSQRRYGSFASNKFAMGSVAWMFRLWIALSQAISPYGQKIRGKFWSPLIWDKNTSCTGWQSASYTVICGLPDLPAPSPS